MAIRMNGTAMRAITGALALVGLAACSNYVTRTDLDAAIAQLRSADQQQQQQIDTLKQELRDLGIKVSDQDTRITAMQGRLRVETPARFAFNDATVREQDKPFLNEFARVMREHHPNALITVEGFADPAGSAAYNKRLGQRRAEAVREQLLQAGGLRADKVRVVSYGEDAERQVVAGAWGPQGEANRRVVLVVDYADASQPSTAG